jgi:hypothetical protein
MIYTLITELLKRRKILTVVEGDIFDHIDEILEHDLIILDIDPHDGIQEAKIYRYFKTRKL